MSKRKHPADRAERMKIDEEKNKKKGNLKGVSKGTPDALPADD